MFVFHKIVREGGEGKGREGKEREGKGRDGRSVKNEFTSFTPQFGGDKIHSFVG